MMDKSLANSEVVTGSDSYEDDGSAVTQQVHCYTHSINDRYPSPTPRYRSTYTCQNDTMIIVFNIDLAIG